MDSEEEEEATKPEQKPVEEPPKAQKASGIALPITEMTDDWMDDGQAIGSMDSEDEEDATTATKSEEKPVEELSKPSTAAVALTTAPCYSPACASGDSRSCYVASCTVQDAQDLLTSTICRGDEQKTDVP